MPLSTSSASLDDGLQSPADAARSLARQRRQFPSRHLPQFQSILAMLIEGPGCGSMGVLVKHRADGRVSCYERVMRVTCLTDRATQPSPAG